MNWNVTVQSKQCTVIIMIQAEVEHQSSIITGYIIYCDSSNTIKCVYV